MLSQSLLKKAVESELINVDLINYRDFGLGKHRNVDDTPYGGGAGMVLRPEPIVDAIEHCEQSVPGGKLRKILISPQGKPFKQQKAIELSQSDVPILMVCGRYEGFDERIRDYADEEISLGDFVLLGGEVAALAMIEAIGRLVPGVIGNYDSLEHESHNQGLLEYAQYTKPYDFRGQTVPDTLLSGNHKEIDKWRVENAIEKTRVRRPDLYQEYLASKKG